jgi:serine/threonine-protein kinase
VCPTTGLRIEGHEQRRQRKRQPHARKHQSEQARMIGQVIDDKYRIVEAIGEGGMSSIYEAEHLGLDRRVALKVLHASLADDAEAVARLRQEAKVVSAIGHPNICEVFDMGRIGRGSHYLVMERLEGESLADRLKDEGPMDFLELAPLVRQILKALAAAHEKGILHRDLKPENIFIENARAFGHPTAKLLDFGISKSMSYDFVEDQRLTHTGMVMGTPYYMAPEQARGDSGLDQRVDLWAVGVIMYEALTGRRPFVATNYNALLVKILTSKPRPVQKLVSTIPDDVAAIVDRALSKLREDRFQDAKEFRKELERVERVRRPEELHAPTPAAAKRRSPAVARAQVSARDWSEAIDDPSTFIDDDLPGAPLPRATKPDRAAASAPPAPRTSPLREPGSWGSFEVEPLEPTMADHVSEGEDWEQSIPYEPDERLRLEPKRRAIEDEGHDTEVMARRDFERAAAAEDVAPPWRVRGAERRPIEFSDRGTEIIDRAALEERARRRAALERHPIDQNDPDGGPTEPTVALHGEVEEETERARGRVRRSGKAEPNIPRPRIATDDEEKTTLFDAAAARARRAVERGSPGSSGEGES